MERDLTPASERQKHEAATPEEVAALKAKAKKLAGYTAVDEFVRSDMLVGLGTGSTACWAVERIAEKLKSGELTNVQGIPTSKATQTQAESLGIPLLKLDELGDRLLDVAIDGADAVDEKLNLIKGGGGAMLYEKMVEISSKKFIVIVDESKLCTRMGRHFAIPVAITNAGSSPMYTIRRIEALPACQGCEAVLRRGDVSNNKKAEGEPVAITDHGDYVVDLYFSADLEEGRLEAMASQLKSLTGVVEHGIFIGMASLVIVAAADGTTSQISPS